MDVFSLDLETATESLLRTIFGVAIIWIMSDSVDSRQTLKCKSEIQYCVKLLVIMNQWQRSEDWELFLFCGCKVCWQFYKDVIC